MKDRERYEDDGRRYPSDLTDAAWELARSLFEAYADRGPPRDGRRLPSPRSGGFPLAGDRCPRASARGGGPCAGGHRGRFRRDGVRAEAATAPTPAARARLGESPAPSTGIVDARSVTSGPQKGERGADGNEGVKGIKRHALACSFGFVLAAFVPAANLHGTRGPAPLLGRAAEAGRGLRRVKVDAIYAGPTW